MKWLAVVLAVPGVFAQSATPQQIRAAAAKSLALLQRASDGFTKAQDCVSCHHTVLPAEAVAMARERGVAVNEGALRASVVKALTKDRGLNSIDRTVQDNRIIDPASSEAAALMLAHDAGVRPSLTTAIQARLIANAQRADGHWVTIRGDGGVAGRISRSTTRTGWGCCTWRRWRIRWRRRRR